VPLLHEEAPLSVCMSVSARQSGPVNCTSHVDACSQHQFSNMEREETGAVLNFVPI